MINNDNELGIQIVAQVKDVNNAIQSINTQLNHVVSTFNNFNITIKNTSNKVRDLSNSAKNIKNLKLSDMFGNVDKLVNSFSRIVNLSKKFADIFMKGIDSINDYSETLNLFDQVMDKMTDKAKKFQDSLEGAFGNYSTDQLYFQAMFQSLTTSMGMQQEYAYIISENMTKLAYDLSSIYNKNQKDVASALRSGLVGQTKPVRNYGMDITEQSLQPILDGLGIDRTVRELSQAEKEIVRYLAMLKQSAVAHGDMARTIESPSNQLRVLKNQLQECAKWFGALFINTFARAMPYINGFVMVIKEIIKSLAILFGYKETDYNNGLKSVEDYSDYLDGVGESADKSAEAVKKLKLQTLGFDQINNINEDNDDSSKGGSGAGIGGIDQRLLDSLKGYDNLMDQTRMKAMQIRDAIMKWLGFTYDETEQVWKLNKGFTRFKAIVTTIGVSLGVMFGVSLVSKMITFGKAFVEIYKGAKLFGIAISSLFTGSCSLALKGTPFMNLSNILASLNASFQGLASALGISAGALAGIIAVIVAVVGVLIYAYNNCESFREKVNELGSNIADIFKGIYNVVVDTLTQIWEVIEPICLIIKDTVIFIIQYLYESIVYYFSNVIDSINGTIKIIKQLFEGDFEGAFQTAKETVQKFRDNWKEHFGKVEEHFKNWVEKCKTNITKFKDTFLEKLKNINDKLSKLPEEFGHWVGKGIGTIVKLIIETDWNELGNKILTGIINGLVQIYLFNQKIKQGIKDLFNSLLEKIKEINWLELGKKVLDGIIQGLNPNNWGGVKLFKQFGDGFVKGLKEVLDIHSPSKRAIPLGMFTGLGINQGLLESIPIIEDTASKLLDGLNNTFTSGMEELSLESAITPSLKQDVANINTYKNNTNINYNMLEEASYNGFARAVKQYGLVNINVRQDKSSIVETAIEGINNITKQSGENPIDLW